MLPAGVGGPIDGYLAALRREVGDQAAAVYAVGALALDDFSVKQSNIDLVVVGDPPLTAAQLGRLRRAERGLDRVRRRAGLWYTCWEEVADDHGPAPPEGIPSRPVIATPPPVAPGPASPASPPGLSPASPPGSSPASPPGPSPALPGSSPASPPVVATPPPVAPSGPACPTSPRPGGPTWPGSGESSAGPAPAPTGTLATPMTRALLRQDPVALMGPDWPVVGYDEAAFRAWCSDRLRALVTGRKGALLLRRAVTPVVLEASRLAQGAITGRVFSKSEAGESIGMIVAPRYRRILTDAVGYRHGAQTSMYWGPFERKYDAQVLLRDLLDVATNR